MYMFTRASALSYGGASYIRLGFVSGQRDSLSLPSQGHPKLKKIQWKTFKNVVLVTPQNVFSVVSFSVISRCVQRKVFDHVWVERVFRVYFGLSSICLCHGHLQKVCVTNATRVL